MRILIVGGAARDMLLGRKPNDFDMLVQGATEEEFLAEHPGAKRVGKGFPVYLYNGEEYAFARTERSTGPAHADFKTEIEDVSIAEDLYRRDLTINAIAVCPETGDRYSVPMAEHDLESKTLRHINASAFREDPLRVLRVARFAAQLEDFTVHPSTLTLMRDMRHLLSALPKERIFKELEKALAAPAPRRFFEILLATDCLSVFPYIEFLPGIPAGPATGKHADERDVFEHTMNVIQRIPADPILRFCGLCHDLGKLATPSSEYPHHHGHAKAGITLVESFCDNLRVPSRWKQAAVLFTEHHMRFHKILEMKAGKAVKLISQIDKSFHKGMLGFTYCALGDGSELRDLLTIIHRANRVLKVTLPERYFGQGKVCGTVLHQLRCDAWKE